MAEVVRHLGAKEGDLAVAGGDDRLGHLAAGAAVRDADGVVDRFAVDVHDLDDGDPGTGQHCAGSGGVFETGDDHPRGTPGQHLVDDGFLAVGQVVGNADDGLQAGAVQDLGNAGHDLGEDHVRQRGDYHADQVHPLAGERPGDLVRDVAQGTGGLQHLGAGRGRDVAPVPQDPADRHFGDARGLGDVAEGQGMARVGSGLGQGAVPFLPVSC